MILKNGTVYDWQFRPQKLDIAIEGERITQVTAHPMKDSEDVLDCTGCTIVPGFLDIHIHGGGGGDTADASVDSLQKMSLYLAKRGVTSFCPTTMTLPEAELSEQLRAVERFKGQEAGAYVQGVHMEGPYISMEKKGAQCGDYVRKADKEEFRRLHAISPIVMVSVAPETEGALDFAGEISPICRVSVAHTNATFEETQKALESGFSHGTHLFNAMPPVKNREPGAVTAILDSETATAEMICDGFHNHPAIVRNAFRLLGEDRAVVVSDAMCAAGCEDGEFVLGGQTVYVRQGKATLANGTIAASTTNIYAEFLNLLQWGIPFRQALKACTINPAKVIGVADQTGSIATGKRADLLVLDEENRIRTVIVRGKCVV